MRYSIDGKFLLQQVTGTQRYACEILRCLGRRASELGLEIVVPPANFAPREYYGIPVKQIGRHKGPLWSQLDYPEYCNDSGTTPVCLCNVAPWFSRSVVVIHDASSRANPSFYERRYRLYVNLSSWINIKLAKAILTVSEFSKREIEKYYPSAAGKVSIVPNAWQHVDRVEPDPSVLARHGLREESYYFAMSSLAPNKNLRWIVETALLNPGETIVVAGGVNSKVFGEHDIPEAGNVKYLGYVTDKEAKALMMGCRGLLFPTFYEGFGIPPMEALACGAPVAVSDTEVMHEVYGGAAHYVDPSVPCESLEALFAAPVETPDSVLTKYSWEKSAKQLASILESAR